MTATMKRDTCHLAGAWLDAAKRLLDDTFGVKFEFWVPGESWRLLSDRHEILDAAPADLMPMATGEALLSETLDSSEPILIDQSLGHQFVLLPVQQNQQTRFVATAMVPSHEPDLVLRLARQFMRESDLQQRIEQMQCENDFFIRQVSQDFEELSFLRSVTEHMELSTVTTDMIQPAQMVLPLLKQSVRAECVLLLDSMEAGDTEDIILATGELSITKQECQQIIAKFRDDARIQPVLENHMTARQETGNLHSFVLVPIAKTERLFGWLLAINRIGATELESNDGFCWSISETEFGTPEAALMGSAASMLATQAINVELFRDKERLLTNVVRALVSAVEAKDKYTYGHSERVARYAAMLGQKLDHDAKACERLYLTGLLHDIGKIAVPDATLGKPGRLTDDEFKTIMLHPDEGWAILISLDQLKYVLPGVLYHHERYDGKGYPDGLTG